MVERLFLIKAPQLPEHIPLAALPDSLGGPYVHSHSAWLKRCLSSVDGDSLLPPPDAVPPPVVPRRNHLNGSSGNGPSVRGDSWRGGQVFTNDVRVFLMLLFFFWCSLWESSSEKLTNSTLPSDRNWKILNFSWMFVLKGGIFSSDSDLFQESFELKLPRLVRLFALKIFTDCFVETGLLTIKT